MVVAFYHWTAALYLASGLVGSLGLALQSQRTSRAAVGLLLAGVAFHTLAFSVLHSAAAPPPLTDLPSAVSFMALVGTVFFLILLWRVKLLPLLVFVAPVAFLCVFFAALRLGAASPAPSAAAGSWPHAHVLLASAGLASLGVAGLAGLLFLHEHHRLKSKRGLQRRLPSPSLEALDRVNVTSLLVGFPLLTLGVVTGMLWVQSEIGHFWSGSAHETFSVIAWAVYAVVVIVRFTSNQGARRAAASAVAGFALLSFAVIGVGLLT